MPLQTLLSRSAYDIVVQQWLASGPKNATYTSLEVQNLLLHLMASTVRQKYCKTAKRAGMYSLQADETKDCRKEEQHFYIFIHGMHHRYIRES